MFFTSLAFEIMKLLEIEITIKMMLNSCTSKKHYLSL